MSTHRQFGGFRKPSRKHFRSQNKKKQKKHPLDPKHFIHRDVEAPEVSTHVPAYTYEDLDIHPNLKQNIKAKGYSQPTPIQEQAIPAILNGE
ncbi:MAG: hypothetical protein ABEI13_04480, partial [Candidatus Paceibacteria bacterium]